MDDVTITFEEAVKYHRAGKIDQAERMYEKILQEFPLHHNALHLLGILSAQKKCFETAEIYLDQAQKHGQPSAELFNSIGNVKKNLRKYSQAQWWYKKSLSLNPNYATAITNLGVLFEKLGDIDKAIEQYKKSIHIQPDYLDPFFNLSNIYLARGELDHVQSLLDTMLDKDPKHPEALHARGLVAQHEKDYSLAKHYFERRLEVDDSNPATHTNLGLCLRELGQPEEAISAFERAIVIEPELLEAHFNLASTCMLLNFHQKALPHYTFLLQHGQKDPEIFYNLGIIYAYQDKHKESIQYFNLALDCQPNDIPTLHNLAMVCLRQGHMELAKKHYRHLLHLAPDDASIEFILQGLESSKQPEKPPVKFVSDLFNQYAPHYDNHLSQCLSYKVPESLVDVLQKAEPIAEKCWDILDLGCGSGLCAPFLKPYTQSIVGIDVSENMLAVAQEKGDYHALIHADIIDVLPNYHEQDLIIAADTLPYLGDVDLLMKRCAIALKNHGKLLLSVEKTTKYPYELQKTIRYAHHHDYLTALCKKYCLNVITLENIICRHQYNHPVEGYVLLAEKQLTEIK